MSSLFKIFLLTLIVCLVGVTLIKGITIYLDKVSVPQKKQIASKPKNFNKNYKSVEPQGLVKDEYTFFNTLHDASMQKFVGLEGIVDKKNEVADDKFIKAGFEQLNNASALSQYFDRDIPAEMAALGMESLQEFMVKPERLEKILERLEKARQKLY